MASYAHTFTSGDTLTPTKLNNARTVSNIVNADIDSAAAIVGTKVAPAFGSQDITVSGANRSITNTGNFSLSFGTNNTNRLTIESNGDAYLSRTSGNPLFGVASAQAAGYAPSILQLARQGAGATATPNNSNLGVLRFDGLDAANTYMNCAGIEAHIGTNATGGAPSYLAFLTAASGAGATERMRIDASGNVGIGKTSPSSKLHISGQTAQFPTALQIDATAHATSRRASVGIGDYLWLQDTSGNGTKDFALFDSNAGAGTRMIVSATGNVGIGGTANAAAILDAASTTKGFLPPRMTTTERNAIATPPAGLVIYNTSTNVLNFYNGTAWGAV
jgi:hypothetical protein